MKCWKCGLELEDGNLFCVYCGSSQTRTEPRTEEGIALRNIYDRFGCKTVLSNKMYIINAIKDLLQDSIKLKNIISMAFDVGVGDLYLYQIESIGKSDKSFKNKIKLVLVEDAGLSEKTAADFIGLFNEMIGWETIVEENPVSDEIHRSVSGKPWLLQSDLNPLSEGFQSEIFRRPPVRRIPL